MLQISTSNRSPRPHEVYISCTYRLSRLATMIFECPMDAEKVVLGDGFDWVNEIYKEDGTRMARLALQLFDVPGVVLVNVGQYTVMIQIAEMFCATEVTDAVEGVIQSFAAAERFACGDNKETET